jgi:hypothetical protein
MTNYIQTFDERLRILFQRKAAEFSKYAEDEPSTACVTIQLAGLYQDLVDAMRH